MPARDYIIFWIACSRLWRCRGTSGNSHLDPPGVLRPPRSGLEPGLYVLVRRTEVEAVLRSLSAGSSSWHRPDQPQASALLSVGPRAVGADRGHSEPSVSTIQSRPTTSSPWAILSGFRGTMMRPGRVADFTDSFAGRPAFFGQVLRQEAKAAAFQREPGSGCYFDDLMHNIP